MWDVTVNDYAILICMWHVRYFVAIKVGIITTWKECKKERGPFYVKSAIYIILVLGK